MSHELAIGYRRAIDDLIACRSGANQHVRTDGAERQGIRGRRKTLVRSLTDEVEKEHDEVCGYHGLDVVEIEDYIARCNSRGIEQCCGASDGIAQTQRERAGVNGNESG